MIFIANKILSSFSTVNSLARYLNPVILQSRSIAEMPMLKLKSQQYLLKNWWSQTPFIIQKSMKVPIFSFKTGDFINQELELPQDIFNCPLRRDLMHRLYDFRLKLNKFTTKVTRTRGMTAGSGAKMRKQKGGGVARMGVKRAPHTHKGGKAHGAKAQIYSYPLNSKIKLTALKALLTAKLVEGKLKIVDEETLSQAKTKELDKVITAHSQDDRTLFCVITCRDRDQNFQKAQRSIRRVIWHDTYNLDVISLFKADKILITKAGLQELIENIYKTHYVIYQQPYMPDIPTGQAQSQAENALNINPEEPYEFKFRILGEYLDLYEKVKKQTPHLLQRQMARIRKVQI